MITSKDQFEELRQREMDEKEPQAMAVSLVPKKILDLERSTLVANAKAIVNAIQDGDLDLVDSFIEVKKAILFFTTLEDNLKGIVYGKSLVAKGQIFKRHSVEIEATDLGVKWNYSGCNDVVLERLLQEQAKANQAVKDRQSYLQVITTISEQVDMETGESYTVNPPVRTATNGYTFSIR